MRLTFLGTRGEIQLRSRLHWRHSALLVERGGGRMLIDCGRDWLGRIGRLRPRAILITHAHDDHVAGLKRGAPCPVHATADTWRAMTGWPLPVRYIVPERQPFVVAGLVVEAWPVEHSLLAPAVGYRISAERRRIFYVPDVAHLPNPRVALRDVDLYIGDGATLERPLIRRRGTVRIGHASIAQQLEWCATAGVENAIFTHCGSPIVRSEPQEIEAAVAAMAREHGVRARLAFDGLTIA